MYTSTSNLYISSKFKDHNVANVDEDDYNEKITPDFVDAPLFVYYFELFFIGDLISKCTSVKLNHGVNVCFQ